MQNGISYGTMIGGFQPQNPGSDPLGNGTEQLVSALTQSNPGLKALGPGDDIRVNGVPGKSVDLSGPSPLTGSDGKPLRERDWLVALQRKDGTLLFLVFIAPEKDFRQLNMDAFVPMLRSVKLN